MFPICRYYYHPYFTAVQRNEEYPAMLWSGSVRIQAWLNLKLRLLTIGTLPLKLYIPLCIIDGFQRFCVGERSLLPPTKWNPVLHQSFCLTTKSFKPYPLSDWVIAHPPTLVPRRTYPPRPGAATGPLSLTSWQPQQQTVLSHRGPQRRLVFSDSDLLAAS